jgi:glycosyl transferase family 25
MRIFIVNLERSGDRREAMRAQLDPLGLDYEFFPAVDGKAGEHFRFANYHEESCLRAWKRPLTAGEVGCFASHYLLWQRCVERREPIIVMEDDVALTARFAEAVRILPSLARFGYVRLAATTPRGLRVVPRALPADWQLVRYLVGPMGTQCYALFPHAAARFLAGADKWTLPVDNYMDCFWQHGVPCIGLIPHPVPVSRSFASTIVTGALSPSTLMRNRVWRPKRFLARKAGDVRRHWANLEYSIGRRKLDLADDIQ